MGTTANRAYPYPAASDNVRPYEDIQALAEALDTEIDTVMDPWSSWTPVISSDSGTPSLGTGPTVTGRYKQIGKTVHARAQITVGTGAAVAAAWYFSLPVAAHASVEASGTVYMRDIAPGANYLGTCVILVAANTGRVALYIGNTQVTSSAPFAIAAGDRINFSISYEAA